MGSVTIQYTAIFQKFLRKPVMKLGAERSSDGPATVIPWRAQNCILKSLEPHSAYLTPKLYKEQHSDTQGRFGGLGIEITVKGGILTVVSPIEDTPAAKAGIKPGDQIFKIEEEFTKDMSLVDAVKKMRGLKGTKIN